MPTKICPMSNRICNYCPFLIGNNSCVIGYDRLYILLRKHNAYIPHGYYSTMDWVIYYILKIWGTKCESDSAD